jgi:hypothetical protein
MLSTNTYNLVQLYKLFVMEHATLSVVVQKGKAGMSWLAFAVDGHVPELEKLYGVLLWTYKPFGTFLDKDSKFQAGLAENAKASLSMRLPDASDEHGAWALDELRATLAADANALDLNLQDMGGVTGVWNSALNAFQAAIDGAVLNMARAQSGDPKKGVYEQAWASIAHANADMPDAVLERMFNAAIERRRFVTIDGGGNAVVNMSYYPFSAVKPEAVVRDASFDARAAQETLASTDSVAANRARVALAANSTNPHVPAAKTALLVGADGVSPLPPHNLPRGSIVAAHGIKFSIAAPKNGIKYAGVSGKPVGIQVVFETSDVAVFKAPALAVPPGAPGSAPAAVPSSPSPLPPPPLSPESATEADGDEFLTPASRKRAQPEESEEPEEPEESEGASVDPWTPKAQIPRRTRQRMVAQ